MDLFFIFFEECKRIPNTSLKKQQKCNILIITYVTLMKKSFSKK